MALASADLESKISESSLSSTGNPAPQLALERERGTVWVVDDSPLEAEVAARLLEAQHDVQTFSDGASVLELFATGLRPDVLVLDWHMPHMSGMDICRFLRQRYDQASLPILVLTAASGHEETLDSLRAGANDFVPKTSNSEEFQARVRTQLRVRVLHERVRRAELAAQHARQSAEEANQAKDTFMATVSHELRTPLSSIVGWAHLLKESEPDEATLRRGLETIERNAKIQIQLIEDILDTTRAISGKLQLELKSIDFADVVRSAVESLKPSADAKGVSVTCKIVAPATSIQGDADRLQQAVWNLLSNATKFTPAGGWIRVELSSTAAELLLAISDSGKGISSEFLPHVFDRFRQQDDSASRRHAGLGLGLALVRHLVAAHGGNVSAHSEGENRGATFHIRLPFDTTKPLGPSASARSLPPPSIRRDLEIGQLVNVKILVVEDDEDARELLVTVLSNQGASVASAASVEDAITELDRARPDVLVSDVGLPGADGFELLRRVRSRHTPEQLPAIALTAYARPEDRDLSREAGFQAHLAKPASPAALVKLIGEVVRRRSSAT